MRLGRNRSAIAVSYTTWWDTIKDDARLVWLRANGTPWKPICRELRISRAMADRHYSTGWQ
ncbi:DUF6362 family protein [Aurantimonas sp. A2-1-M11]|uniref:DUF6362 family protein n=1 Tax=Aurantimonas sp. A2-1-M11 TaxID=3113712 RepID=UPI002F95F24E